MKQSEEYRSRHSMEVPGKSTEVPGKSTEVPDKSTEVPDNCQELPWSRKKSLYGCHENAAWQQLTHVTAINFYTVIYYHAEFAVRKVRVYSKESRSFLTVKSSCSGRG